MAQLLGVSTLYLFAGVLAYLILRSGVRVDFWVPLTTREDVALIFLVNATALAAVAGSSAALALAAAGVGRTLAWAVGAVAAVAILAVLRRPALRRYERDVSTVEARRTARADAKQRRRQRR